MEPLSLVLFALFALILLVQLFYYWALFSRFAFASNRELSTKKLPPVSVVVCARNEEDNLKRFLPQLLQQDYPDYEVVVVNDLSGDETAVVLEALQKEHNHLRVFTLSQHLNFFSGKKFPLSLGIKATRHEHLLLTDADCYPKSDQWIRTMMQGYDNDTEVVIGYGAYEKRKGLLNALIRYETLKTAVQYFSYALMGMPYMGTGRNLSYKKTLFYRVGGFVSHYKVASGDDDLFVNKAADKGNTQVVYKKESHTVSQPETSFGKWFTQKGRHLTTGKLYKKRDKKWLGTYALSKTALYALFIVLMIIPAPQPYFFIILGAMAVLVITQMVIMQMAARQLDEKKLGYASPLLELFFVIFEPLWAVKSILSKNNQWK